ncbi:uncharacterized protein LOC114531345 [Dendronephthya gigantea]|uniref:uncharacterized protein LOC114531345 n=1 Tax=Dendronephthya gigantea TaxID=151771 RepID=UPI00106CD7D9|nr:uncharacterized protein LOC114531345 [Dendronephthya gigantea]
MATAGAVSTISDDERRWVIVGICLNKVLTPLLRDVLGNEIPMWYQSLLPPPHEIDKQIFGRHKKNLAPSTLKLNYESINNNHTNHKSFVSKYDYAVKDAVSLAKLFVKPFMANFSGFDDTMDTSAALSLVAEAQPFHASGAGGTAKKIRSDVRNEWAHCDFAHWTDVVYQAALKDMETLINQLNLTHEEQKKTLDDLNGWKKKGLDLCFGQPVDSELLKVVKTEVAELRDSMKDWKRDAEFEQSKLSNALEGIEKSFTQVIHKLKKDVEQLKVGQLVLYDSFSRKHEEPPCLFMAPKQSVWFSGRESELTSLRDILDNESGSIDEKVTVIAISGLGGSGKTSLAGEYIYKWRDYYKGGVFWISGQDDVKLKASFDDIAAQFNTLDSDSVDATLSKTLAVFSRISRSWLMIIDDMDGPSLSQNLLKLISGSWQANINGFGHIIITTRRTPRELNEDISGFKESRCLQLDSFGCDEAKNFVFKRTGISRDEQADNTADLLYQNLGGLPLALEQACAYIVSLRCTLPDYLEAYEKQSLHLLSKKTASTPFGTSPERLAVHTTWILNFEHIRKDVNGIFAIRFLNASAFFDRNEIQKDLINVGEPRVDDKAYCDHVSSSLGPLEVLKLLTDFSFFKKTHDSSLTVHRLVQEVIRESLTLDAKVESIVDAARVLRFAFLKCPSPDSISESVLTEKGDRSSLHSIDSSCFYKWHKLCLHAYEIKSNLELLLKDVSNVRGKTVFLPEVARAVYECALHLNVNNSSSQAKAAGDFANRILDWNRNEIRKQDLKVVFPHRFPLLEPLRRRIQYSCKAPSEKDDLSIPNTSANDFTNSEIETLRLKGNYLFKKSNFEEAIKLYSSCIDKSKEINSFDPRLFSNRASAYLRLEQYENALSDAEEYIKHSPDCWKGHARQALALFGLGQKWDAMCAAAVAFYHDRNIFDEYKPFKISFPKLKESIHICNEASALASACFHLPRGGYSGMPEKIIVLESGEYSLSLKLHLDNIILVGVGGDVQISFLDRFGLSNSGNFMAVNISFIFKYGSWVTKPNSLVRVCNCSITSENDHCAFVSSGDLFVKKSCFSNCQNDALRVIHGRARIVDSVFSANNSDGLKVNGEKGSTYTTLESCKLYGNEIGVNVDFGTCDVNGCQMYDNKKFGVAVGKGGKLTLTRNEIFHNDRDGVYLEKSSAKIEENEIFQNGWFGISIIARNDESSYVVSDNKISRNKCGGIHATPTSKLQPPSVIKSNWISGNEGPGIDQTKSYPDSINSPPSTLPNDENLQEAKCADNILKNNIEDGEPPPLQVLPHVCSFCHKNDKLKKCTRCYISGYCNPKCQRGDWEHHKKNCAKVLDKYTVLVKVLPLSICLIGDKRVLPDFSEMKAPYDWLEPSGPEYERAPEFGKRFIVKVQACDSWRKSNEGGTMLAMEDRSQTINGDLDMNDEQCLRIYNLVRECGSNCNSYGWKKKFLWALLAKENKVRVFTSDFPPYQFW